MYPCSRHLTHACATQSFDKDTENTTTPKCTLRFLLQGNPPLSAAQDSIGPEMTVPIHPNQPSKASRRIVVPSRSLPWKDCYFSSFMAADVICKPAPLAPIYQSTFIPRKDLKYLQLTMLQDIRTNDMARGFTRPLSSASSSMLTSPSDELPAREMLGYAHLNSTVVVNLSFDLTSFTSVPNPRQFFVDASQLVR